jgi:periplasmic copper chaperone A
MVHRGKGRPVTANWRVAGAAATLAVLLFTGLAAQGKGVAASDGWVKLPAPGESGAMAFVAIENPTMYGIYVTSAVSDAAAKIELRDAGQSADARQKPLEFISVPAYDRVDMRPGGVHLLLVDLKRPLKEGDKVALTLSTDNAGTLEVAAVVRKE